MVVRLLWDPLPETWPATPGRGRLLGNLRARIAAAVAVGRLSAQERVGLRVRRGAVQALVREAYQQTIAEQDTEHRGPDRFALAWKAHLASMLEQDTVEVTGWSAITVTDVDVDVELAWNLYEAADRARRQTLAGASATPSRPFRVGDRQTSTFTFAIVEGTEATLGEVKYGICAPCRVGLLYKIGFPPDWQFSGLGRLALDQLEAATRA